MPKLPVLSGKDVIKALSKIGFTHVRTRGSHAILNKQTEKGKVTISCSIAQRTCQRDIKEHYETV